MGRGQDGALEAEEPRRPPVLVAAAVLREQGRILLTRRRKGTHLEDYWEFPGGKVEPGEDPRSTVARECREECALELEVQDIFHVAFHRYETKDVLILFYECGRPRSRVGAPVAHIGVSDHAWVSPAELRRYRLPPADEAVVSKLAGPDPCLDSTNPRR